MIKRICILFLMLVQLVPSFVQSAERPLIVVLKNKDIEPYMTALTSFQETLNRLKAFPRIEIYDFTEKNDGNDERLLASIRTQEPALIFTMGTTVAQYVSTRIKNIPIVFSMVVDPTLLKAENVTGVTLEIPASKQLEMLKQCIPSTKMVAVLYNPIENESFITQAKQAANTLGLKLNAISVKNPREIPNIDNLDMDALWIIPDNTICQPSIIQRLLLSGLKSNIPVLGISAAYAKAGALLALSCDYKDIGRQAGEMAEKILHGEKCANLKISPPGEIKLFLNLAVAQRLTIKIPSEIIKKAEQVFGK